MTHPQGMWIIGYGSLIFKPPPHVSLKVTGYLKGFIRRFWQSSIDHRGTPEYPGRVVTLLSLDDLHSNNKFHDEWVSPEDLRVYGVAYYIEPQYVEEVKQYLDIREQNGYTSHKVAFYVLDKSVSMFTDKEGDYIESNIYIGKVDNEAFVGPESLEETAHVIRKAVGPSGLNIDYLTNLVHSIKDFGIRDHYLENLYTLASSSPDNSTLPIPKPAPPY